MKTIEVKYFSDVPGNFTGIAKIPDGTKEWFKNGKLHREDGPAIEWADGMKEWYKDGEHHREDGPAVELANEYKEWWIDGKLHREDGPAAEYSNGIKEWFLNDIPLTEEQHKIIMIFSKESREKLYENDNRGLKNLLAIK